MNDTKESPDKAFEDSFDEYLGKLDEHLERVAAATELLPAWFVARMMDDVWQFGLMLTSGRTIGISQILNVTEDKAGNIWIDAVMLGRDPGQTSIDILTAPCPERLNISINARHIVAVLEIAYT